MFGLGFGEIVFIAVIALVLFGDKNLPQNIKKFAQWLRGAKDVTQQAQRSWMEVKNDISRSILQDVEKVSQSPRISAVSPDSIPASLDAPSDPVVSVAPASSTEVSSPPYVPPS